MGQASHVATMEINEDIPAYVRKCRSTAQPMDTSAPAQSMARPPTAQEVNPSAFPAAEPDGCVRRRIHDMEDLELIIGYFQKDCQRTMQKGVCEVVMAIYLKP